MKLLKSYLCLRSTMTDDRLTGLALMYIHPEVEIDVGEIIRRFTAMPAKSTGQRGRHLGLPPISISMPQTPQRRRKQLH